MSWTGRTILAAVTLVCATGAAFSRDLVWDGRTYLDIGLRLGADSTLVFPEPVEYSAENEAAFELAESTTDPRVLTVRPRALHEQRVTFIGTRSKTVYLARVSTRQSYSPLYRIHSRTEAEPGKAAGGAAASGPSPTALLRSMLAGVPTQGIAVRRHAQDLVAGPQYRIAATELWQLPGMTGVVATLTLQQGVDAATVRPADISLRIPAFGQLRMMGADRWDLQGELRSVTAYFVFTQ